MPASSARLLPGTSLTCSTILGRGGAAGGSGGTSGRGGLSRWPAGGPSLRGLGGSGGAGAKGSSSSVLATAAAACGVGRRCGGRRRLGLAGTQQGAATKLRAGRRKKWDGKVARMYLVPTDQQQEEEEEEEEEDKGGTAAITALAHIEVEQLTDEQRLAASLALEGQNLFLTGPAGTGKSFVLRFIIQELEALYPGEVAVTAPTGIAAVNIGGQTLHSFLGLGLGTGRPSALLTKVKRSSKAKARWQNTRVLVIDEVSMLDARLFDALDYIARNIRGPSKSRPDFGGLQIILCGDFLQLPPVPDKATRARQFCFQGNRWGPAGFNDGTIILQKIVRQSSDPLFADVLNEIRNGIVSWQGRALLEPCKMKELPSDGIIPTKLYCLNRDVDAENQARLDELEGVAKTFVTQELFGGEDLKAETRKILRKQMDAKVLPELQLKVGAQVILTKNAFELQLFNGSRGIVTAFRSGLPVVQFDNDILVRVGQQVAEYGTPRAWMKRVYVPLKLGWALTVHRAQGMTLSRAELDFDTVFEEGQAYVALSRLRSSEGLWIRGQGVSEQTVRANAEVLRFYSDRGCLEAKHALERTGYELPGIAQSR